MPTFNSLTTKCGKSTATGSPSDPESSDTSFHFSHFFCSVRSSKMTQKEHLCPILSCAEQWLCLQLPFYLFLSSNMWLVKTGIENVTSSKSSKISRETAFNTSHLSLPHQSPCHLSHPLLQEKGPSVKEWVSAPFFFSVMEWVWHLFISRSELWQLFCHGVSNGPFCVKKQALAPLLKKKLLALFLLSWSTGTYFYVKKWGLALF